MTVGTDNMHLSAIPVSLFLKLPATMLLISPTASNICLSPGGIFAPSMRDAIDAADLAVHRRLTRPQSWPASPTMAMSSPDDDSESPLLCSLQFNMSSNTSRAANSSNGCHSWRALGEAVAP